MKRDFKGIWIPAQIWLNKDLNLIEKCFLVEIDSLDNSDGCFASNGYFAEFFGISKSRCSQIIKSIESKKLISIQYHYEGKQIIKRVLRILKGGIKNIKEGYLENCEDNNTDSDFDSVPVSCSDSAPLKTETEKKKEKNSAQKRKKFSVHDCKFPEVFENNPILKQTFLDFAEMRQQMKKGYKTKKGTETKLNSLAKDCIRYGIENVIGAINFSLESEYLGIFVHDYCKRQKQQQQNEKRTNNNTTESTSIHEDFARRVKRDLDEEIRLIRLNKMQK
jgi:hypothetical protein